MSLWKTIKLYFKTKFQLSFIGYLNEVLIIEEVNYRRSWLKTLKCSLKRNFSFRLSVILMRFWIIEEVG